MPAPSILVILFGLVVGSFLNVVISRLPKGQSIVIPRSHCPNCGRFIRWYDNIPIFSFLMLLGKCRECKKPISWRYPIVEGLTASLSYLVFLKFGATLDYLLYFLLFVSPLIAISFIDLKHQIIPDVISLPGIPVGVLVALLERGFKGGIFLESLLGILAGGGTLFLIGWVYEKTRKREGLGMGDVKLAAMLGAFFGWKGVFVILLLSSLLGSVVGVTFIALTRKGLKYAIPYGPFLAAGALIHLFYGPELLSLYLNWTYQIY